MTNTHTIDLTAGGGSFERAATEYVVVPPTHTRGVVYVDAQHWGASTPPVLHVRRAPPVVGGVRAGESAQSQGDAAMDPAVTLTGSVNTSGLVVSAAFDVHPGQRLRVRVVTPADAAADTQARVTVVTWDKQ